MLVDFAEDTNNVWFIREDASERRNISLKLLWTFRATNITPSFICLNTSEFGGTKKLNDLRLRCDKILVKLISSEIVSGSIFWAWSSFDEEGVWSEPSPINLKRFNVVAQETWPESYGKIFNELNTMKSNIRIGVTYVYSFLFSQLS